MTIVYVVSEGDYSDYHIVGIFSSEDKVDQFLKQEYLENIEESNEYIAYQQEQYNKPHNERDGIYQTEDGNRRILENIMFNRERIEQYQALIDNKPEKIEDKKRWYIERLRVEEYILDRKVG